MAGWTSPATGAAWPDKGPAIAAWFVTGIEAWRQIVGNYGSKGTPGSNDDVDRVTLHPDVQSGEIGQTALLMFAGATEMLRGLGALYHAYPQFPLTRAHLPTFRSLQEHCGRVIWLLEPGTEIGPTSGTLPDDARYTTSTAAFHERAMRLRMLKEELLDDRLAAAKKQGDTQAEAQARIEGALTLANRRDRRQQSGENFPGYASFAEICERSTQAIHLAAPDRTKGPYGRVSETSHGGLFGLLGDSSVSPNGLRQFTTNFEDLEGVAARAGHWWQTAIAYCCTYFGWDWEATFKPFDETLVALFP